MGDNIFLDPKRKQQRGEGKKKENFNIIKFNEDYFNDFLKLLKYSLMSDKNKRDINNYDEYIIKSLEDI